jgi:hypothetical protein
LQADEFAGAAILAQHQLGMPEFFKEHDWDVTELLIKSCPAERNTTEDRRARYAFLWNNAEFEARLHRSWLWRQRSSWKDEIKSHYARFQVDDSSAFEERQAKTCLILEERLKELVGAVELFHGSYYTNHQIIAAIAKFIATRDPPNISRAYAPPEAKSS